MFKVLVNYNGASDELTFSYVQIDSCECAT